MNEISCLPLGDSAFRRITLQTHGNSSGHKKCMAAYDAKHNPQETPLAKLSRRLHSQQQDKLVYLFNTAHSVAMYNWSLKDFKPLCELQVIILFFMKAYFYLF